VDHIAYLTAISLLRNYIRTAIDYLLLLHCVQVASRQLSNKIILCCVVLCCVVLCCVVLCCVVLCCVVLCCVVLCVVLCCVVLCCVVLCCVVLYCNVTSRYFAVDKHVKSSSAAIGINWRYLSANFAKKRKLISHSEGLNSTEPQRGTVRHLTARH